MPTPPIFPGVYVEEIPNSIHAIAGVPTSITAFIGRAAQGPTDDPVNIFGYNDFELQFGGLGLAFPMSYAVRDFFTNGGNRAIIVRLNSVSVSDSATIIGQRQAKTGLYALEKTDHFNILCVPPDARDGETPVDVYQAALKYCVERRAMLIVDAPSSWSSNPETATSDAQVAMATYPLLGPDAGNAALYFPRLVQQDPLNGNQLGRFAPCGAVAGVMARTDSTRGVWKAPAGLDAAIIGTHGLDVPFTDAESGVLNPLGINCLRHLRQNSVVIWGSRTLRGADLFADEYKYVPVRRTALFIEESLYRGTNWAVFETNNEALWKQIRLAVGSFMQGLFGHGAFQGSTPAQAYFIKCDAATTTQNDIDRGILNILVGFAPLKPAEFVVIKIQQMTARN